MLINIPYNEGILKSYATTLFIYSGPFAYDFIHKNMQQGLLHLEAYSNLFTVFTKSVYWENWFAVINTNYDGIMQNALRN